MNRSRKYMASRSICLVLFIVAGFSPGLHSEPGTTTTTRVTGMDTIHSVVGAPEKWVELPSDISRMLVSVSRYHLYMPDDAAKIIFSLKYAKSKAGDIYGYAHRPDVWVMRFPAVEGNKDGLAVSVRLGCDDLRNHQIRLRRAGVKDLPTSVLPSCDWLTRFPTGRLETGLLLFLASPDGALEPVHEVPGTFFPQITPAMMRQLQERGIGRPIIAPGGHEGKIHLHVFMEEDPDRPLPDDTPGYDNQGTVYGGMMLWTGSGFVIRHEDPDTPPADR